jgi:hypothetical protein
MRLPISIALPAVLACLAACSGSNDLAPASVPNVVDTATLGALNGSPIPLPSAYSIADGNPVRTDLTSAFDFAYDVDSAGRHVFLTLEVLRLSNTNGSGPGLQFSTQQFDQITQAPTENWITGDTVVLHVGDVLTARSRIACTGLGVPLYGKLEIMSFNDTPGDRTITFQVLSDENCGYRSLVPGLPKF